MHYDEDIAKIRKIKKNMIKYLSHANNLRFSFRYYHGKILPKDLQLKSRIKTQQSKTILQCAGKLLSQERIYLNHIIYRKWTRE